MKSICLMTVLALAALQSHAQEYSFEEGVVIDKVRVTPSDTALRIDMRIDVSALDLASKKAIFIVPTVKADADSISLPKIGILGRRQWIYYYRNFADGTTVDSLLVRRRNNTSQIFQYSHTLPVKGKPDFVKVYVDKDLCGCAGDMLDSERVLLSDNNFSDFRPRLSHMRPKAEMPKKRIENGKALIDFPLNETTIYLDYRDNKAELAKIRQSIELVLSDSDISITGVRFMGYASPEGPYDGNRRLASARMDALAAHVKGMYSLDSGLVSSDYVAENWDGLRAYVDSSSLSDRSALLDIIDSDAAPDAKETRMRREHPESFAHLLQRCFPALRYTEYEIDYNVQQFDVARAREIIWKRPQKLSLEEMYAVAQTYETGSEEYNEVFQIAVRMFPEDPVANLNAANAALQKGELSAAARYLQKAGDSPEAYTARGALAFHEGDLGKAEECFMQARAGGDPNAEYNLSELTRIMKMKE